jgi:hypothetical protein
MSQRNVWDNFLETGYAACKDGMDFELGVFAARRYIEVDSGLAALFEKELWRI